MTVTFHRVEILHTAVPGAVVMNQIGAPIADASTTHGLLELLVVGCEDDVNSHLAVLVATGTPPNVVDDFLRNGVDPVAFAQAGFDPGVPLVLDHSPSMSSRVDVARGRLVPIIRSRSSKSCSEMRHQP